MCLLDNDFSITGEMPEFYRNYRTFEIPLDLGVRRTSALPSTNSICPTQEVSRTPWELN